ncbi:MAG: transposase [Myxococcota bacterium]
MLNERGKQLKTQVVETNGRSLVEFMKLVPGRRHLCLEEGASSQWLYEILSPFAQSIAVVRGEKKHGNKSDALDAQELAERMRTGRLGNPIYKAPASYHALRDLVRTYGMITEDVVRTKNRIKSIYRSRGIPTTGRQDVYHPKRRVEASAVLKPATRYATELLGWELDRLEELKKEAQKAMLAESRKHAITRILETAPGIGPIRSARLVAIVVSPHRFRTSRQFWSYCGLGIVTHSSADWIQSSGGEWVRSNVQKTGGLNRNHNPLCRAIFKDAATSVITMMPKEPLHGDYQRLLEAGTKPNLAKLTIARKIAAAVLAMWKNDGPSRPQEKCGSPVWKNEFASSSSVSEVSRK